VLDLGGPAVRVPLQRELLDRGEDDLAASPAKQLPQVVHRVGLLDQAHQVLGPDELVVELVVEVGAVHL